MQKMTQGLRRVFSCLGEKEIPQKMDKGDGKKRHPQIIQALAIALALA